jgi:hypothetical protein
MHVSTVKQPQSRFYSQVTLITVQKSRFYVHVLNFTNLYTCYANQCSNIMH